MVYEGMIDVLLADFPKLPLQEDRTDELILSSVDWAHANGLVTRTRENKNRSDICQTAPFALLPTPFPRKLFQQAINVQNLMATLYHEVAYDYNFLIECHKDVIKTDEFTRGLIEILQQVMTEGKVILLESFICVAYAHSLIFQGLAQRKTLVIQRSDYMCHKDPFSCEYYLRQIEVNNIASSMGGHAERVTKMHRRTLFELGYSTETIERAIPKNEPIKLIAEALYKAWEVFSLPEAVVLVIVEDENQNQIDQRHVEYALEDMGVPVDQIVRKTLTQCDECLILSPERHLLLLGSRVAVVYFRSGYSPNHYPSKKEWAARLLIERSDAIKAPWIGLQVANTKKTQQVSGNRSVHYPLEDLKINFSDKLFEVLAEDGVVERFVGHPRDAAAIRSTFAGLWAISGSHPLTDKLIKNAIAHPSRFVLKPQLEGGGGNFYGEQVAEKLQTLSGEERGAYILMERIQPLVAENYLIRAMEPVALSSVVSELGVYGYALGERGIPEVRQGGHLLRTKPDNVDEGGVAVGAAVIDSPFLYELL
ncbi:glutathione synthase [Dictyocaulus viviparus]|uniref:Glutathione synthetase n=1 Tax=Dictyocaulus viviparus TaxID=29172 RepID=A0A0D8XZU8_DICVI|nr:glutathione synthase [Dictyocaulus viviparus]